MCCAEFRESLVRIVCLGILLASFHSFAEDDPWNALLAKGGLTLDDVQIPTKQFYNMGKFPRNTFKSVWEDWTKLDSVASGAGKGFLVASGSCRQLVGTAATYNDTDASSKVGRTIRFGSRRKRLFKSIEKIHEIGKAPLTKSQRKALKTAIGKIPKDVAGRAAGILSVVPAACSLRDKSLNGVAEADERSALFDHALRLTHHYKVPPPTRKLLENGDMDSLTSGALTLSKAIDRAIAGTPGWADSEFTFEHRTPLGIVAINGKQDNTYNQGDYLLIVDVGGDDVYLDGATTNNGDTPVSLLIDYAGNDRYTSDGICFGVGILGYGMLVDCGGMDTYDTTSGLGYCAWGVGLLLDLGTDNDTYKIKTRGLACGSMGIALVNDMGGNDSYYCRWLGQGIARVGACAALVDVAGNDVYEADDSKIDNPSPQTKKHNTSLAMGCGFGRRAHPGDGYSLAGGVGLLVDGSGDDTYASGVFGQGIAYWFALGMLIDFEGNDQHTGVWYSQGAAAHYAVGAMLDRDGDDVYRLTMNQGQGHGRDFSTGLLHDVGGSDIIEGPRSAVGNANMNGIGLFWKQNGKADFRCPGNAPGSVGNARGKVMNLGLFVAENGTFQFKPDSEAGPERTWIRPPNPKNPKSRGLGMASARKILSE
jgi:hypothetical protein